VVASGRTDAGVHASGQVAHFDTDWDRSVAELHGALNALLPRDVAVLAIDKAPAGFHARHSALSRTYRYSIWNGAIRSPLLRHGTVHVSARLDVDSMQRAAEQFIGIHDFGAFGKPMTPDGPTVRRLDELRVEGRDGMVIIDVRANAFLRHQVRRTAGFLIEVGRGRCSEAAAAALLAGLDAGEIGVAPPRRAAARGLVLTEVEYPPDDEIASRASAFGAPTVSERAK